MPSKFDLLREGEPVEFKPGLIGKLNKEDRTMEFSDGFKVDVSKDRDIYPENEQALAHSREKEKIRKQISGSPLGEFGFQLGERGIFKSAKNWANKLDLTQTGEEYLRNKRASEEISQEISEESPYLSMAATGASFIPDLLLTKGLGAGRSAAGLSVAHAGPRILEEPGQVATEAALSGSAGYLIGKGANWLSDVAARRGASRQVAKAAQEIPERNAAGRIASKLASEEEKSSYNILRERVGRENEARMHQYRLETDAYKKRALDSKNAYEKAKFDRESQIFRIKQEKEAAKAAKSTDQARLNKEYQSALENWKKEKKLLESQAALNEKQYQDALKNLPTLQREAQEAYGKEVLKAAKNIETSFPADSKISSNSLDIDEFLHSKVFRGNLAGTPQARSLHKIIRSIFPKTHSFSGKELAKRYESLESAIARSSPEARVILSELKEHIGEKLPNALADNIAYKNILPSLQNHLSKNIDRITNSLSLPKVSNISGEKLSKLAKERLKSVIDKISPDQFIEKMRSGQISEMLKNGLLNEADFTAAFSQGANLSALKKQGVAHLLEQSNEYKYLQDLYRKYLTEVDSSINNLIARNELKLLTASDRAINKLGGKVEKTFGVASPLEEPIRPINPSIPEAPSRGYSNLPEPPVQSLPPPISPPAIEASPVSPAMAPSPQAPMARSFIPEQIPTLPPAQSFTDQAGDLLEKKLFGGKSLTNNPLLKLGALKYALGKGAIPVEAGYAALKGLTSPTAAGEAARGVARAGGIESVVHLAEKYNTYHDGILDDPQERRSLTKEIENDPSMSLEEKALIQSKINRGKPIFDRL